MSWQKVRSNTELFKYLIRPFCHRSWEQQNFTRVQRGSWQMCGRSKSKDIILTDKVSGLYITGAWKTHRQSITAHLLNSYAFACNCYLQLTALTYSAGHSSGLILEDKVAGGGGKRGPGTAVQSGCSLLCDSKIFGWGEGSGQRWSDWRLRGGICKKQEKT